MVEKRNAKLIVIKFLNGPKAKLAWNGVGTRGSGEKQTDGVIIHIKNHIIQSAYVCNLWNCRFFGGTVRSSIIIAVVSAAIIFVIVIFFVLVVDGSFIFLWVYFSQSASRFAVILPIPVLHHYMQLFMSWSYSITSNILWRFGKPQKM